MRYLYVLINLAILTGPLALSFDRKVAFYRHWPRLGLSLLVVSTGYIIWDVIVTSIGHWWFSPEYSGLITIAGLPLGEILFFITVPYSCLFIYEVVRAYFNERRTDRTGAVRIIGFFVGALFMVLALVFRGQGYTALAMLSISLLAVVTVVFDPGMWMSTHTLLFFVLSYIPFLIANGVLTALPIVGYNPEAIWGIRVYTIPLEDFFYNLGMLGFYLFFFRRFARVLPPARPDLEG